MNKDARIAELEAALRKLVALEDMRLRLQKLHEMGHGTDYVYYHNGLPLAWEAARAALAAKPAEPAPTKLWLWKNFVGGRPEYWAFDNPFPVRMDCWDPQTLGEPCGYALFKPSRTGRTDVSEAEVLRRIAAAEPAPGLTDAEIEVMAQAATAPEWWDPMGEWHMGMNYRAFARAIEAKVRG